MRNTKNAIDNDKTVLTLGEGETNVAGTSAPTASSDSAASIADMDVEFHETKEGIYTVPMKIGDKTFFISTADVLKLIATEEGKEIRKEIRTANGEKAKLAKAKADKIRDGYLATIADLAKELSDNGINIDITGLANPISVKKAAMTIIGFSYKSPIGKGGARYYVNHSAKKTTAETAEKLKHLGRLVSLAASEAAQRAGAEVMRKMAPVLGLELNGLDVADEGVNDGSEDGSDE